MNESVRPCFRFPFSLRFLRQTPQGIAAQHDWTPSIAKLGSQRLVQLNRSLIPVDYFPVDSVTFSFNRNSRHRSQQRRPDPAPSKSFPDKQIFKKQTPSSPRRIVVKEKSISRRLRVPIRDERAKGRILPKSVTAQVLFGNRYQIEFVFKLRQLADHRPQQSSI